MGEFVKGVEFPNLSSSYKVDGECLSLSNSVLKGHTVNSPPSTLYFPSKLLQ